MIPLLLACSDYAVEKYPPEPSVTQPSVILSPPSVDLGLVPVGEPATATFSLEAIGSVTLDQVTISGAGFTLPLEWTGTSLDDEVVDLEVIFSSEATGTQTGRLDVWSAAAIGGRLTGTLSATLPEPAVEVTPASAEVVSGAEAVFTVTSVGGAPLHVTALVVDGDGFRLSTTEPPPALDPGDDTMVEVGYAGTGGAGTLTVFSDDPAHPEVTVDLVGHDPCDWDEDEDGSPLCEDCVDTDATISPERSEICGDGIDQDCDGRDATGVVVGVVPAAFQSDHWGDSLMLWPAVAAVWETYGSCPIEVVDVDPGFTLDSLSDAGVTVLVASALVDYDRDESEVANIKAFADASGGVIFTAPLVWVGWERDQWFDYSDLAYLAGVDRGQIDPVESYGYHDDDVTTLEPEHDLMAGLPAAWQTSHWPYFQQPLTKSWGDALLPGGIVLAENRDSAEAVLAYQGDSWRGVWFTGLADYSTDHPQALYNAAVWAGAR